MTLAGPVHDLAAQSGRSTSRPYPPRTNDQTFREARPRPSWREEQPVSTNAAYALRVVPLRDSKGNPVQLRNYHAATNVTLARLVSFIRTNPVNLATFEPGKFVCTEYGQALHNAAETAGLRAGVVVVDFEKGEGHVLNVFETTDKGLVYVDCTGSLNTNANVPRHEFDTFGYLKVGKKYGRLRLNIGYADPNHYEQFEKIERQFIQSETNQARWRRERPLLLQADKALAAEERKLGPPPWPPALQAQGEALAWKRQELDRKNQELLQLQRSVNISVRELGMFIFHSNPSPVTRFKTWW